MYGTSEAIQESHWNAWEKVLKSLVVQRQVMFLCLYYNARLPET